MKGDPPRGNDQGQEGAVGQGGERLALRARRTDRGVTCPERTVSSHGLPRLLPRSATSPVCHVHGDHPWQHPEGAMASAQRESCTPLSYCVCLPFILYPSLPPPPSSPTLLPAPRWPLLPATRSFV